MREIFYRQALQEALCEEMRRDEKVFLIGEDIGVYGGAFGVTRGMLEEFGPERIIETPISEAAICGIATGAAFLGMRPVLEIMFMDFLALCMDQLANHMAKMKYIFGGADAVRIPIVIRTPAGGGRSYGASHSQSLEAWILHVPGIKIATPANASDAKGLLKAAIRDDNPVLFVEHKLLYSARGVVPDGEHLVTFGKARIAREGEDITLIAYSHMVTLALEAAEHLAQEGISARVVDLRTLCPLDLDTIVDSAARTGRVVVLEEGTRTGGVGAEICATIVEHAFWNLEAPVERVAAVDVPIPYSPPLESLALPRVESILASCHRALGLQT